MVLHGHLLEEKCFELNVSQCLVKVKITQTGQLGDVMQESIKAAITVVKTRCHDLGIDIEQFDKKDIHIHVPEGATLKTDQCRHYNGTGSSIYIIVYSNQV